MPDSKRPSGPGQQKHARRADATTQEEIDETILERAEASDEVKRVARDAHATAPAGAPTRPSGRPR